MVRSLRQRMGDYAHCIETVSGIGYKLRMTSALSVAFLPTV